MHWLQWHSDNRVNVSRAVYIVRIESKGHYWCSNVSCDWYIFNLLWRPGRDIASLTVDGRPFHGLCHCNWKWMVSRSSATRQPDEQSLAFVSGVRTAPYKFCHSRPYFKLHIRCSIKKEQVIFDYNCHISWSIFRILPSMVTRMNTP